MANRNSVLRVRWLLPALVLVCAAATVQAATITIVNGDGPGEGFNDPTPVAPVGGNTGTTLGEQRQIVFEAAATIWGAALPSDVPPLTRYFGITVILSFIGWTGLARVVRGQFLALRDQDFVLAATIAGASEWRVIVRHMVPSFMSYLIASVTLSIPGMILGETSLSFLGLGLKPPIVSWGVMLRDAQALRFVAQAPWLLLTGAFVVGAVLAFNFVGDGLRDAMDPYGR